MFKYSIIIPTYNKCEELLKPCLESIIKYTNTKSDDIEIIVVSNGCKDNTKKYILFIEPTVIKNLTLLSFVNPLGYSKAINKGLEIATGEYIVLLNNDTILLNQYKNQWLDILVKPMEENNNVGITGPMKVFSESAGREFIIFFCVMISRKVINTLGFLDESFAEGYGEDTAYCIEAEKAGFKVIQVPYESKEYYEDKKMIGSFPIYHIGNQTFKDQSDENLIHRNNEILRKRYNMINISKALECDGFMSEEELKWLATQSKDKNIIVEIGSWHGRSSRAIADNLPENGILYCIDHWKGSELERTTNHASAFMNEGDHAFMEFCNNLADHIIKGKVIPLRMSSLNAFNFFSTNNIKPDMVFIDAGHTYEEVKNDILNWKCLLKHGSLLCGHDYFHPNNPWPGVKQAVDEIIVCTPIQGTSIWSYVMNIMSINKQIAKGNIYDCFTFNNELDILEIRLNELYDVVDRFIIVEALKTHSNRSKELCFHNNLKRFEKFLHKITYLVVESFPYTDSWGIERYQRDYIMKGLEGCKDNDIIIISDVDEIPRYERIKEYKLEDGLCTFEQDLFYYYLNCKAIDQVWRWSKILPYSTLKKMSPCEVRYTSGNNIKNGGWHFSYMGGIDSIIEKIKNTAHQEYNKPEFLDRNEIDKRIFNGEDVFGRTNMKFKYIKIDESFPSYVIWKEKDLEIKNLVYNL